MTFSQQPPIGPYPLPINKHSFE